MGQITLTGKKTKVCPNCDMGMKEKDVYVDDYKINNIPIKVKSFYCPHCDTNYTFYTCVLCGKEYLKSNVKGLIDCYLPYVCPECRQKSNIRDIILDKFFPIKYCDKCGLPFPSKNGEKTTCNECLEK